MIHLHRPIASARLFILGSVLLFASLTIACTNDDAVADCNQLIDVYCVEADTCYGALFEDGSFYDDCISRMQEALGCDDAVDVSDDYDRCLDDIEASDCSSPDELPEVCKGVILVSR